MNARLTTPSAGTSGRSFLLTNWVTIRGGSTVLSVTQDADEWLELPGFADATFYVDVSNVTLPTLASTGLVLLYLETSPTPDESGFLAQPLVGPIPLTPTTTPIVLQSASGSATPLCRYVRYRLVSTLGATWDATLRIRGVANRSTYFTPNQLGNCAFWVRADRGFAFSGNTITSWAEQATNDTKKTLNAAGGAGASTNPTFTLADSSFGSQPSVAFSGNASCYFTSNIWTTNLNQPDTWVLVGKLASATTNYFINGNTAIAGFGQAIWVSGTINASAGTNLTQAGTWTSAGAVMCEFNGASSKFYTFNSFTSVAASGNIGASVVNALAFGVNNTNFIPPANTWNGSIVEAMAFSGVLSTTQKQRLSRYLNNRYGLPIT